MSDIYRTGAMDPYIRLALDRADVVREIYRRVANVQHPDAWLPVRVICPTCGKVGTTIVTDWDGEKVFYECRPTSSRGRRAAATSGWIIPFGGTAKLPWNLEWAAQWSLFGVTIEAGRQGPRRRLAARATGATRSRARCSSASRRSTSRTSSSTSAARRCRPRRARRGRPHDRRGHPARAAALPVPAPRPNQAIEFDPEGTDAVPRLFDEFDRSPAATAGRDVKGSCRPATRRRSAMRWSIRTPTSRPRRPLSGPPLRTSPARPDPGRRRRRRARPRRRGVPLTEREAAILENANRAARAWLEAYAPERARLHRARRAARRGRGLDDDQRDFLAANSPTPSAPSAGL